MSSGSTHTHAHVHTHMYLHHSWSTQHDVLWNDLTAQEHMELFAGMKGVPRNKQKKEIRDLLERVQLNRVSNWVIGLLLDIFLNTCMCTHTHTHTHTGC